MKRNLSHQHSSKTQYRPRKGFTLVELLVVMAIIATLATIATVWGTKVYHNSKVKSKTLQYKQLFVANEGYAADNGGICPAKINNTLWPTLLSPYLNSQGNKDGTIKDDFWPDYDKKKPFLSGIGMAYKHLSPESNAKNWFESSDGSDGTYMSFEDITNRNTRILMGDSTNWFLNDKKIDATRHKDDTKGMFLTFDGMVVYYTAAEAKQGLTNPGKLQK